MPSVKILEDIPEDKGLLAHAARLLRATFAQDWERVDPWLAHDFSDQKPLQGQVDGPAGYKQVASTLLAELGSKYSFSVAWISQGRVLADIDFGTADQPKRRIVWELIFRNRVLIERTMMSAGCTLFRELYDERHPRSSWNRFCDEVSDLAKGIATLRAAIIVCALFGILMLLPAQTWELIREAPFNEEDPFTFENLLIGSTLLSAAIALFGWLELIECGEREVTALPGDVRPVKTLVFKTRRLGLLAILAGTIPLLTGLALLKARLPLPDAAGEDAATFSSWDWVSIGLMTTPRVPKVTPLHIHWALTIWGYISLVCGALVIAGGAAFICAPRRWLGTLVVESYRKYFWIAVVVTGFAAFALVFPTTGLNSAPVIFTSWCVLMLATLSVITQIASRTRFPLLLFLICLFIGLSLSDVNDNHAVRLASKDSTAGQTPDITQAFKDWLAARPDPKSKERYPVFVVAAEGG